MEVWVVVATWFDTSGNSAQDIAGVFSTEGNALAYTMEQRKSKFNMDYYYEAHKVDKEVRHHDDEAPA